MKGRVRAEKAHDLELLDVVRNRLLGMGGEKTSSGVVDQRVLASSCGLASSRSEDFEAISGAGRRGWWCVPM